MTINERIKRVRSNANMTLVEFGKKIGLTKSTVSRMEQNGYSVIPQNVQLICSTFNISEKWLTEGQGDMYTSDEDAILDKLAGMYDLSDSQMIFAKQWLQLPATAKDAVVDYIVSVASALHREKDKKNAVSEADTAKNDIDDKELSQRNEAHRLLDQELDAQEKAQSASTFGSSDMTENEIDA